MGSKISNTELNKENLLVTYIFELDENGECEEIEQWIRDDDGPSINEVTNLTL